MKKISFVLLLLALAITTANAQDFKVSAGVGGTFAVGKINYTSDLYNVDLTSLNAGVSAFVDFTYFALNIGYANQIGATAVYTGPLAPFIPAYVNTNTGFLNLRGVFKYPFQLSRSFALFPAIGLEYSIVVSDDKMSTWSDEYKKDANDLYLVLGVGSDIGLGDVVYLRITADFDYNLTVTPTAPTAGATYSSYKVNAGVAVGFKF